METTPETPTTPAVNPHDDSRGRGPDRFRWWALAWVVLALAVAGWWIDHTDMFCRRGYIANDGECAWE